MANTPGSLRIWLHDRKTGQPVAGAKVRAEVEILAGLAEWAENNLADMAQYRPRETVAEFRRMLFRELDFGREERNLQVFASNFAANAMVHFPRTCPELSTSRVPTMEWLEGIPLSDPEALRAAGHDLGELARRGASICLEMIFRDGFYHANPHPGNVLVLKDGVIGLIDCGMVGQLDDTMRKDIEELLLAVANGDAERLTGVIPRIGKVPLRLDHAGLLADVQE